MLASTLLGLAHNLVDPVYTPYYANGTLNLGAVPAYASVLAQTGANTVLLGGSTGEWPSLTHGERLDLLSAWRSAIDALPSSTRPKLLFHAGDVSIAGAQALARQAKPRGADQILIVSPMIMAPSTLEGLVATIRTIAAESPLPAYYYHYPGLYHVDFRMDWFVERAANAHTGIPTLAGVKYVDSNQVTLANATGVAGGRFEFFIGPPFLAGIALGGRGSLCYSIECPLVKAVADALASGDWVAASAAERRLIEYQGLLSAHAGGATVPGRRWLPGIMDPAAALGQPRPPLPRIDVDADALKRALEQAGFLPV